MARVVGHVLPKQATGGNLVTAGDRVLDRPIGIAPPSVDVARAQVQRSHPATAAALELAEQHLTQEGVVTEIAVEAVERNDQGVRARKPAQILGRSLAVEQRIAGLPVELLEHRAFDQEVAIACLDGRDQLLPQVFRDHVIVSGKAPDRVFRVRRVGERKGCQVDRYRPTLRVLGKLL